MLTKNRQTYERLEELFINLPVLADSRATEKGRIKVLILTHMKAITSSISIDTSGLVLYPSTIFYNDDGSIVRDATGQFSVNLSDIDNQATYQSVITAAILGYAASQSYTVTDYVWGIDLQGILSSGPTSYQTIVSQTGTAAPAVSGGFTPTNTYAGGVTFTWARTGAGVYTLTASSAIFNTSGKTGVFISPLNNLNASVRGVVTSTTVITVTTAVQSVAVLGLLGLTTTSTDALLTNTMIYVQTYA